MCQSDVKATNRFIEKKNQDTVKMQEIVSSFKDRLMEKYQVLSDEYTEQFKRIDGKYMYIHEQIALLTEKHEQLKHGHSEL